MEIRLVYSDMKIDIPLGQNGKASISLDRNEHHIIKVISESSPFQKDSNRDKAWRVISLFDGLTVGQAHDILRKLEPNIQGNVGRPLGWIVDALEKDAIEIHEPD